jgi:hypothetical protein
MFTRPQRILVLYWYPSQMRPAILHHLQALNYSEIPHEVIYYNTLNRVFSWLRYLNFDAVILHNTLLGLRWSATFYNWKSGLNWLRDLNCVKLAIPQDEYDHCEVLDEWLLELGVSGIFTNFDENYRKILYPLMSSQASFYRCFTGYIDDLIAKQYAEKLPPTEARPYDIVYRASHLPYWFGSQGQLKHEIGDIIGQRALEYGLNCNISTRLEDTIVDNQWFDFLASGKTIIGCESGSSALDRRGEIKAQIQHILKENPQLSFAEVSALMPVGWDEYRFFAISPRHFEAIITKTCQILVEGQYDGVLEADRHYIPLKRDFSNLTEVLEKVKDSKLIEEITERAYQEIYLSGKNNYQILAEMIERAIFENQKPMQPTKFPSIRLPWNLVKIAVKVSEVLEKNIFIARELLLTGVLVLRELSLTGILVLRELSLTGVLVLRELSLTGILVLRELSLTGVLVLRELLLTAILVLRELFLTSLIRVYKAIFKPLKIVIAFYSALKTPILRQILVDYFKNKSIRKQSSLNNLLKDLWWVEIVKQITTKTTKFNSQFRLLICANPEKESITFISQPIDEDVAQIADKLKETEGITCEENNWPAFEVALQKGLVKKITLDHSAVGNSIQYPLTAAIGLKIEMEPNGIYEFKSLPAVVSGWCQNRLSPSGMESNQGSK